MKLTSSTQFDIEQLTEWIQADPYHRDCLDPHWWLTGNGLLSYCIQDQTGPTMYVRVDDENGLLRIHTQFAPLAEVSKLRVIKSITRALPVMKQLAKDNKLTGFIFKSTSPSLIQFMQIKFGFTPTGTDNDYWLPFEGIYGTCPHQDKQEG